MKEIFPNYYKKFKCIADKCKHSCCIGWEIDIDDDTLDFYNALDSELGERIRKNIEGEVPHFVLGEGERCPLLNENGLCDVISELGENGVCDICRMHPRFCNFYDDFTEIGLGLCCEEAARIVLTEAESFFIDLPESAKSRELFAERGEVFDILQSRSESVLERLDKLAAKYGFITKPSTDELYELYKSLERLDKGWDIELEKLKGADMTSALERKDLQILFEQLACYFIFRHFEGGVGFTLVSMLALGVICAKCESIDEVLDIVRMYSSEIEYSEENTEKVREFLR